MGLPSPGCLNPFPLCFDRIPTPSGLIFFPGPIFDIYGRLSLFVYTLGIPSVGSEKMSQNQENAMSVAQTAESVDMAPAMHIVEEMSPLTNGDIIPLLQRLQEAYGYLPKEMVLAVCEEVGLPASRVFGVATFYSQFSLQPQGRNLVRCCKGTACHVRGGHRVLDSVERTLGVTDGETTKDMSFTLETVACLGTCFLAPVVTVNDTYYGQVSPDRLKKVLAQYE
jgi:NADH-quinone oxidoreductase subunit E